MASKTKDLKRNINGLKMNMRGKFTQLTLKVPNEKLGAIMIAIGSILDGRHVPSETANVKTRRGRRSGKSKNRVTHPSETFDNDCSGKCSVTSNPPKSKGVGDVPQDCLPDCKTINTVKRVWRVRDQSPTVLSDNESVITPMLMSAVPIQAALNVALKPNDVHSPRNDQPEGDGEEVKELALILRTKEQNLEEDVFKTMLEEDIFKIFNKAINQHNENVRSHIEQKHTNWFGTIRKCDCATKMERVNFVKLSRNSDTSRIRDEFIYAQSKYSSYLSKTANKASKNKVPIPPRVRGNARQHRRNMIPKDKHVSQDSITDEMSIAANMNKISWM